MKVFFISLTYLACSVNQLNWSCTKAFPFVHLGPVDSSFHNWVGWTGIKGLIRHTWLN